MGDILSFDVFAFCWLARLTLLCVSVCVCVCVCVRVCVRGEGRIPTRVREKDEREKGEEGGFAQRDRRHARWDGSVDMCSGGGGRHLSIARQETYRFISPVRSLSALERSIHEIPKTRSLTGMEAAERTKDCQAPNLIGAAMSGPRMAGE